MVIISNGKVSCVLGRGHIGHVVQNYTIYSRAKCRQTEYMIIMNKGGFVVTLISLHQELELL